MSNNTDSIKDIYWEGRIYCNVISPESQWIFSNEKCKCTGCSAYDKEFISKLESYSVLNPPASWKDGQPLELNKDYGLQCQWYIRVADRWDNCSDDQYEAVAEEASRRIIALPLPYSVRGEVAEMREAKELVEKFMPVCYCEYKEGLGWEHASKKHYAKACAIIHCDGVIEVLNGLLKYDELKNNFFLVDGINDWGKLREAINNI